MYEGIAEQADIRLRAEDFLRRKRRTVGARTIAILRLQPGQSIPVDRLCRLLYSPDAPPEAAGDHVFAPIPLADAKAQGQYLERRRRLAARKEAGDGDPDLDWELDFLDRELRRITRPRGGIKRSAPELVKAYHNLKSHLWHLLKAASREDPAVHAWLRSRLSTGMAFLWRGD